MWILLLFIVGSVAATYYRYVIKRDYAVEAQTDCDPETEKCFIWKCDPRALEGEEKCTGVPDNDIWYYQVVRRNAKNIPLCDPKDENCAALTCEPGEQGCSVEFCTPENVPNGEECNDPEKYILENPPEEGTCEEGDEECLQAQEEECAPDDEECLAAQEDTECAPDDEECLSAQEEESGEECAPDDQECLDAQAAKEECAPGDENCNSSGN